MKQSCGHDLCLWRAMLNACPYLQTGDTCGHAEIFARHVLVDDASDHDPSQLVHFLEVLIPRCWSLPCDLLQLSDECLLLVRSYWLFGLKAVAGKLLHED